MNPFQNKIVQFLVFVVSLGLCLSAIGTILDLWHRKDIVSTRQTDLTTITKENQKLEQQLQDTKSSDYVEKIARNKLGMVKDGESIILLPEVGSKPQVQQEITEPHWKIWWRLFF